MPLILSDADDADKTLGTAIYTFFIVPDNVTHFAHEVTLLANMSVFLDDELVGNILHVPDNKTDFIYNFLGYVNTSLSNDTHMLSISANNEVASSLILFDYYIYTYVFSLSLLVFLLMARQNGFKSS